MTWLGTLSEVAAVATAVLAVYAYGHYRRSLYKRRRKVEALLASKTTSGDTSLTTEQIAAALIMTIEQVIEAAARSDMIEGWGGPSGNERRLRLKKR